MFWCPVPELRGAAIEAYLARLALSPPAVRADVVSKY